jgi:hypothetical protein
VIKEAESSMHNNQVINSANIMKITWTIIKTEINTLKGIPEFS